VYADENVWLSQKMMAQLYDVGTPTINYHLRKVFSDRARGGGSCSKFSNNCCRRRDHAAARSPDWHGRGHTVDRPLDMIADRWRPIARGTRWEPWWRDFERRYVDLNESEAPQRGPM